MPKKVGGDPVLSAIQDLLIFQMAAEGIPQQDIRKAMGLEMGRVTRIAKLLNRRKKDGNNEK